MSGIINILYFAIFWLSIIGYAIYFSYRFKIRHEFILCFIFSIISICVFMFGLLNILKIGSLFLMLVGFYLLFLSFKNYKINIFKDFRKNYVNIIIISAIMIYVTIVFWNSHILHYDNFSHWGLIVKNMLLNDMLPNFQNTAIEFKAYQPGTACFIYYFANLFKFSESTMVIGQNYLLFSFLIPLLSFIEDKNKILYRILILVFMVFTFVSNSLPFNLLVDTILSVIMISIFIFLFTYRNDKNKQIYMTLPLILLLSLVKNTGLVLILIICSINFIYYLYNRDIKHAFKSSLIYIVLSFALLYIWTCHVTYVYGSDALYSHHALTVNNIISHIHILGTQNIIKFIKIYLKNFVDFRFNLATLVVIIINLLLIIIAFIKKDKWKNTALILVLIDYIYIIYYIFLGIMYICSMDISGLYELAGFGRYIITILVVLIAIFIMYYIYVFNSLKFKILIYIFTIFVIGLLFCYMQFYNKKDFILSRDYNILFGYSTYNKNYSKKFDLYLKNKYINMDNNFRYFVYIPGEKDKVAYVLYMSRYKFNHRNVIICDKIDMIKDYTEESLILTFDNNKKFKKLMKSINFCEVDDNIYKFCN